MPGNRNSSHNTQSTGSQREEPFIKVDKIWLDKKEGLIKPEALSEVAKDCAYRIYQDFIESGKKLNKTSQLRKFYDEIFKLNQLSKIPTTEVKRKELNFLKIRSELHRQIALAYYAKGRKLVSKNFVNMLETLIKEVKNEKDLQVVTDFLEAFIAYYKYFNPKT